MKIDRVSRSETLLGFTLVETIVAVWVAAVMISALYASFACGFATVRYNREDLRATQIMLSRIESMRLCNFAQATNPTNNPPSFTEYFDPKDKATGGEGALYSGSTKVVVPPPGSVPEAYRTNMLLVSVDLSWNTGKVPHNRSMQTYIARDGMQPYVSVGK